MPGSPTFGLLPQATLESADRRVPLDSQTQEQQGSRQRLHGITDREDPAAVVAVGDISRDEEQRSDRHELGESDIAERQRTARDRVDPPGDRNRLNLVPKARKTR
jgi:hypothetical protein